MKQERGNVSVTTENIFPIIRQWLYADRDIFLRELVSNSSDAIEKLKHLAVLGETKLEEQDRFSIRVVWDPAAGTLQVEDNGIGMTADEVKKYINQIAFSGAMDFVEKYKEKGTDTAGIIGHFGLGFYSAFMVADNVRIDTQSWDLSAPAVYWESTDGIGYEMGESDYPTRGSRITLTLSEDGKKLLEEITVGDILRKYCGFMPYPIYLEEIKPEEDKVEDEAEEKTADTDMDSEDVQAEEEPKPINDVHPLWQKAPKDCTDEEYKAFYRSTFQDFREPLFWVHLNMDYPFNLKGILYFPRTNNRYESLEGRIKVFYNQVFVADNVKEILPEFLFLLRGAIDCPDLPLNVSRSFLQNDAYVQKLSQHIVRKVADKLLSLIQSDRETYAGYWKDIGVFVKYGILRDEKFYDRVKDAVLFPLVDGEPVTLSEFGETVYYTPDPKQQVIYINRAKEKGLKVAVLDHELDNHFMSFLEHKNSGLKFMRVDASLDGEEKEDEKDLQEKAERVFRVIAEDDKLKLRLLAMGADALPAMIQESEESRRMEEMRKQFQQYQTDGADMADLFPEERTLVLNTDHPVVTRLLPLLEQENPDEKTRSIGRHLYDMARLGHGTLDADGMVGFLNRMAGYLNELVD